jgi:hypothetical protein
MRVLSVQQPWAHLIVRGMRTVEVRSWTSDYRGRIAIHASSAVPSKEIEAEWQRDEKTARVFADQGWRSRNDLKSLPRSAIVGTVELRGVHLGKTLHQQNARPIPRHDFNQALYSALGRVGGGYGWTQPRVEPAPVVIPDDQYAWTFGKPCVIDPIEDVLGLQRLWTLPKEIAATVQEREDATRSGQWKPPATDYGKRRRAMEDWGRQWDKLYDDLGWRLLLEAYWEVQATQFDFEDEDFEKQFRRTLRKWIEQYGVVVPGAGLHVRVPPTLGKWFDDRPIVRALEFEATVRWELQEQIRKDEEDARAHSYHAQVTGLLRDLKARAARRPISNAEIVKRVKDECKRLLEEGVQAEMRAHGL